MNYKKISSKRWPKFISWFKKSNHLLYFSLLLILFGSLFAHASNTSFYKVKVSKITLNVNSEHMHSTTSDELYDRKLEGLLYMPKTCNNDNPCPLIITTHDYLNSKEIQNAPSIELSKRGYIVLAIDMYDHGGSTWQTPAAFSFWQTALWDAATIMYEKDYVLKSSDGDGMIAVSGHSMGGFSSHLAIYYDEQNYKKLLLDNPLNAHRKIAINLAVGADFTRIEEPDYYSNDNKVTMSHEEILREYADRTSGTIAAHYDEFFFLDRTALNSDMSSGGYNFPSKTVVYKDFVNTSTGKYYLGNEINLLNDEEYSAGVLYKVKLNANGDYVSTEEHYIGQRVIYTPEETHAFNQFSTESTAYMIEFFSESFKYQMGLHADLDYMSMDLSEGKGQTWWLKNWFEFAALIGLFLAIIPFITLLLKKKFFRQIISTENVEIEEVRDNDNHARNDKLSLMISVLFVSLFPAFYFPSLITRGSELNVFVRLAEGILFILFLFVIALWISFIVMKLLHKEETAKFSKYFFNITKSCLVIASIALLLRYIAINPNEFFKNGYWWNAPAINQVGYFLIISSIFSLLAFVIIHYTTKKPLGITYKNYGLKASLKQVAISLLLAIVVLVCMYSLVFIINLIFTTDFRLLTYAVKPFKLQHLVSFFKYASIFFIYYFINSLIVVSNTKNIKGWKGYLYGIVLNVGGLLLFLAYNYGKLFVSGTAAVPELALEPILLYGLIPSLALAAVFAKKLHGKTNNVWLGAFLNSMLFTFIAVTNTTIYLLSM